MKPLRGFQRCVQKKTIIILNLGMWQSLSVKKTTLKYSHITSSRPMLLVLGKRDRQRVPPSIIVLSYFSLGPFRSYSYRSMLLFSNLTFFAQSQTGGGGS